MDNAIEKKAYPPRLFSDGKGPPQVKSMNHYCNLANIGILKESLGDDVWKYLLDSPVGVICKLADSNFIWSAKTVHYLLTHQLATKKPHELWVLVDDQPLRFSLNEFAEITGMNTEHYVDDENWDVNHEELWNDMEVTITEGPNWLQLAEVLSQCRTWSFAKRRMVGCLCVIHIGVLGLHRASRIPLKLAKRVVDVEAFESFPWGRQTCESLVESVKLAQYEGNSYVIGGCVPILQIWAYETIDILGEEYGGGIQSLDVPLLCWRGSRKRFSFEELLTKDKKNHSSVRVRNLILKDLWEMQPAWNDDIPDERVALLIQDILDKCVNGKCWALVKSNKKKRKKQAVTSDDDDFLEKKTLTYNTKEKQKENKVSSSKKDTKVSSSKTDELGPRQPRKSSGNGSREKLNESIDPPNDDLMKVLVNAIESLSSKVFALDSNITKACNEIKEDMDKRMTVMENKVDGKIVSLEKELKMLKEAHIPENKEAMHSNANVDEVADSKPVNKDVMHSIANVDDGAESKDPSWMVVNKPSSVEGLPIRCVVRSAKHKRKIKEEEKDVVDVTDEVARAEEQMVKPNSDSTFSDPVRCDNSDKVDFAFSCISKALDVNTPVDKRRRYLAASQNSPFLGNSTVRRIMKGVIPSSAVYDPFGPINMDKLQQLLTRINEEESVPIGSFSPVTNFYQRLMTPKEKWPQNEPDYGYLGDNHLTVFLHMLRKRSLRQPTPFCNTRIAFLEQNFVQSWVRDFKQFSMNPKNFLFRDTYIEVLNGLYPLYAITKKRWLHDVDHLYFAHNIDNLHWIAVHVNLLKKHIDVYDSIVGFCDDKKIAEEVRPYAKMIPYMLRSVASPGEKQNIPLKQYTIYRKKNIPQNCQSGDCGVYAMKYIECLALGYSFEGLSDRNIAFIRAKMAVEIFDEAPDTDTQMSNPLPRGNQNDRLLLHNNSQK